MLREVLSIGDKIDIKPLNRNGKPVHSANTFVSQLVDFVDGNIINIVAPIVFGRTIPLPVGEYYNLCFYTEKGLYQCNCMIISNHRDNKTIITVVRITTNLEKFQRRQYYRLECIHDIRYRPVPLEEEILEKRMSSDKFETPEAMAEAKNKLAEYDKEWISASVTDLSGGGARFSSVALHNTGDKVRIKLDFIIGKELKKLELTANIISQARIPVRVGMYEYRVEFIDIMQKDREALIKYIFEQERKRRRNDKV
jgi:c-di-GMP-binding flagellar brake protein YcgR